MKIASCDLYAIKHNYKFLNLKYTREFSVITCKIFWLVFIIAIYCSCNSTESKQISSILQNELKVIDVIHFGDKEYFESCFLVKLDTKEECLINDIDQIEVLDNKIYILDIKQSRVMVFDLRGNYLYCIGNQGRGPEEYLYVSAFYIDNEHVYLFDPMNMAVFQYKATGEFCEKIKHKNQNIGFIKKAIPVSNNKLFAYSATNWEDNAIFSLIDRKDYHTIKNLRYYPEKSENFVSYFYSRQPFSKDGNKVTFSSLFSDTLSIYEDQKTTPLLIVQNKQNIPRDLLKSRLESSECDYSLVIREMNQENKYNTGILNVFENNTFLLCDFKSDICMSAVLYNKESKQGVRVKNYCHYYPDFGDYMTRSNNTLVRVWRNDAITAFKDEIEQDEAKRGQYPKSLIDLVTQHHTEEDNPILIFYEFKDSRADEKNGENCLTRKMS